MTDPGPLDPGALDPGSPGPGLPASAELSAEQAAEQEERDGLDGYTLEELDAYLEAGRMPVDEAIESSPACQIALAGLERLQVLSTTLLETEATTQPPLDDRWIARILELISVDAQAGRDIPLDDELTDELVITEGAVRGIIRDVGDDLDGILLGRVRLVGDVTLRDEPIRITVDASVFWGHDMRDIVARVRGAIVEALRIHTRLNVVAVDVTVQDVEVPRPSAEDPR